MLQIEMLQLCSEYGIDSRMVFAMMYVESRYITNKIGDNGKSYGLLQIQPRWWSDLMRREGVTDLLDPVQNVKCCCAILTYMYELYGDDTAVLQAYNTGKPDNNNGYAQKVYSAMNELGVREYADGGCP